MRIALAVLFLALAAGAAWFATATGEDSASDPEDGAALTPSGTRARPTTPEKPEVETLVAQPAAAVQPQPKAPKAAPRSLDGTVADRFGAPIPNERVWLLPPGATHPPEGADLTTFVTARTSRSGSFSLTLPDEGPWSLGVGARGAPRVPPSAPRKMLGGTRAEVFVPGSAGLRVELAALPEGDVTLELMTLREPGAVDGGGFGGGRGRGNGATGGRRGGGNRGRGGDQGGRGGGGGGQAMVAPARDVALASLAQDPGGAQEGTGRRRGFRGPGDTTPGTRPEPSVRPQGGQPGAQQDAPELPVEPPAEIWRSTRRIKIGDEAREAGFVRFESVPVGWVGRLDLVQGDERYEGASRFGLQADALTEVKLMPFEPRPGALLVYTAIARPLGAAESPPGVHFPQ